MKTITILDKFNEPVEYELRETIASIFDENIAGQVATNGNYYILHRDHKDHSHIYAITRAEERRIYKLGKSLEEGENPTQFLGEWARPMTFHEEMAWNRDELNADVDLWGNIRFSVTDLISEIISWEQLSKLPINGNVYYIGHFYGYELFADENKRVYGVERS